MLHKDYRNQCISFLLGRTATARPDTYYFGISKTAIKEDGTGITEPASATGYARVALSNNSATWNEAVDGKVTNKIEIRFQELKADAGEATHYFLSVSKTGGTAFWSGVLPVKRPLVQWGTLLVKPGDASFSIENP